MINKVVIQCNVVNGNTQINRSTIQTMKCIVQIINNLSEIKWLSAIDEL